MLVRIEAGLPLAYAKAQPGGGRGGLIQRGSGEGQSRLEMGAPQCLN